jgi:hypothetical protein
VIIAEILEFFLNLGILNLGWIIPLTATILWEIYRERDKRTTLRKIFYRVFNKRFKVRIDAEIQYNAHFEDIKTIENKIVSEFSNNGTVITRRDCGSNWLNFWINNSQAAYYIELNPNVEDDEGAGTQVLVKLQSTLTYQYRSNDNIVYIDLLEQLVQMVKEAIHQEPDFANYHLEAMLSDSGISGIPVKELEEPKTDTHIVVKTNGLRGDSKSATTLFRLAQKGLPYAPPA